MISDLLTADQLWNLAAVCTEWAALWPSAGSRGTWWFTTVPAKTYTGSTVFMGKH